MMQRAKIGLVRQPDLVTLLDGHGLHDRAKRKTCQYVVSALYV